MLPLIAWDELGRFIITALVAVLCGTIVGLERESKGKPAGVRTLVLISLGSSFYVHVSLLLSGAHGDPARVAAQIVAGVGFLGAGAILQKSELGYVAGLTTAASIWVTAAIGMIVGAGHYMSAVAAVLITVLALRLLHDLEGYLFYESNIETKRVVFDSNFGKTKWAVLGLLEENLVRPDEYEFKDEDKSTPVLEFRYVHKNRNHRAFLAAIAKLQEIREMG